MHDIVIRGGTVIDGSGKPAFTGDVAIADGRIVGVGGKQGPGKREIDADGLLVTPGWVDVHTHYDGQAMWDPLLAPSCSSSPRTPRKGPRPSPRNVLRTSRAADVNVMDSCTANRANKLLLEQDELTFANCVVPSAIAEPVAAPSPLVGEGYSDFQHTMMGEGSVTPHPTEYVDSRAMPSPTRGEGKNGYRRRFNLKLSRIQTRPLQT